MRQSLETGSRTAGRRRLLLVKRFSKENSSQTGIIYHTTQLDREEKVDLNKEREGESTERASIGNFLMW